MSISNSVPVLGVDTGVWLTSRVDPSGERHFYLGAATKNQRLNLPGSDIVFINPESSADAITVALDTEMVSGLAEEDRAARRLDHVYAMSRCSVSARVACMNDSMLLVPRYGVDGCIAETSSVSVRVRLEVETVYDLLIRWNERASEKDVAIARKLQLSPGDQIMVVNGDSTSILILGPKCKRGEFKSTVYRIGLTSQCDPGDLLMPTLNGTARIGVIESV